MTGDKSKFLSLETYDGGTVVTTRLTVDWVNRVITRFVFQETEITLPKLKQRGHKLFNVTNSAKSQNQHLTNTQDNHTILYKSDITSTAKTNLHLSKNLIQSYKFLSAQLNIHPWNAICNSITKLENHYQLLLT